MENEKFLEKYRSEWSTFIWILIVISILFALVKSCIEGGWGMFVICFFLALGTNLLLVHAFGKKMHDWMMGEYFGDCYTWRIGVVIILFALLSQSFKSTPIGDKRFVILTATQEVQPQGEWSWRNPFLFEFKNLRKEHSYEIGTDNYTEMVTVIFSEETKRGVSLVQDYFVVRDMIAEVLYDVETPIGISKKQEDEVKGLIKSAFNKEGCVCDVTYWRRQHHNVPPQD